MNDIEVLSPAGNYESLKCAIDCGADACYFGGKVFSARKGAVNLSNEEIKDAVQYAHLRGAKLYAAVNTMVFNDELESAFKFVKFCYESGVDAVIIQDLGIARMVKKYFPSFRMHASTQMTIHNLSGVLTAKEIGFSRVVLSRELSLEDIKYISENTDVELEVFVHGALCMSYSGQCLMSSFLGGRSGNRGACAQPCRLPYTLLDDSLSEVSEKDKYLLSLKDLCLIDYISELKKAGVTSLKIEGRMKSSSYVSAVSGIYNKYRDGKTVSEKDKDLLKNIFSRNGFTNSYYLGKHGRDMLSYEKSHDDIFDSATKEVIEDAKSFADVKRKTLIDASFVMKENEPAVFEAVYNGRKFSQKTTESSQKAVNISIDKDRAESQLRKLGNTVFEYKTLSLNIDDGLYIPIKEINNVRRDVCSKIEEYILEKNVKYEVGNFSLVSWDCKIKKAKYTASVLTKSQADACYDLGFSRIYIPYSLYMEYKEEFDSDSDIFCVSLPCISHKNNFYSNISLESVCITNIGQAKDLKGKYKMFGDYRLNISNNYSLDLLSAMGFFGACLSTEMTYEQIKNISSPIEKEILVYGRISLMTVKNCLVYSSLKKCGCKKDDFFYLRDRKDMCFPVKCIKGECINIIYNSVPLYMADKKKDLTYCNADAYRFDFTDESAGEIYNIFKNYENGKKSEKMFTRGHFYNGVI